MNARQYIAHTKQMGRVSRGMPSSRKLHRGEIRIDHIMQRRDWFESRIEKATDDAKDDKTVLNRAMAGIYAVAKMFAPWRKKRT